MINITDYCLYRQTVLGLVESQITVLTTIRDHITEQPLRDDLDTEVTRLNELLFDLEASSP